MYPIINTFEMCIFCRTEQVYLQRDYLSESESLVRNIAFRYK